MEDEVKDPNSRERELLADYVAKRNIKEQFEAQASAAGKEMETAKNKLVEFLDDMGKRSTGKYDDLGSVTITEPIATFKIPDDKKENIPSWVKEIGAGDIIKETINHMTLQSLFRERMQKNEGIPDFVEVKYIPQVKYNKPTA
jgi:hypothetical protein